MDERFEQILDLALKMKCTDIHFNFSEGNHSISIRGINGLKKLSENYNDVLLFNYLMYRSRLDITNKKPQSGSFNYFFKNQFYDFRFAVIITNRMKSGVLRILNCHYGLKLEDITCEKQMQQNLLATINKRNGFVIFSGPTGSGKTTTMYSLLKMLKGKTIYSLEDPIEVIQDNITQLEINEKKGFGFDEGIRQILRHNPDVLMIGEIRDETTAKMAVRAALTGCLVVCSLHAHSAVSAINRLLELGVKANDLMDITEAIYNQRLVRIKNNKSYICVFEVIENDDVINYIRNGVGKSLLKENISKLIEQGVIEDDIY